MGFRPFFLCGPTGPIYLRGQLGADSPSRQGAAPMLTDTALRKAQRAARAQQDANSLGTRI